MSVTTIYPAIHSSPDFMMLGIGLGVSLLLIVALMKYFQLYNGRAIQCFGQFF